MISFEPNPQDRRAPFVILESRGKRAIADAETQTVPWLFDLARGFEEKTLKRIVWSLRTIRWRLGERNKIYTD
jgi:DNA-binding MarR family transcriptional regulator